MGRFLLFLAEWFYQARRGDSSAFHWRRAATNFSLGGSYLGFELIVQALIVLPICLWLYQYRLFTIEVTWLSAIPIFIAVEFSYYWFHRSSHRVNWFWSAHVVHHSDDQMNLSTAMRQSLLYSVTGWWLFFVPLMLLGVHPVWVFFFYAIDLIYQFFIHTETVGKLPSGLNIFLIPLLTIGLIMVLMVSISTKTMVASLYCLTAGSELMSKKMLLTIRCVTGQLASAVTIIFFS